MARIPSLRCLTSASNRCNRPAIPSERALDANAQLRASGMRDAMSASPSARRRAQNGNSAEDARGNSELDNPMHAPETNQEPFDVVVVGGGPAGLSGALMLGRCRRRVVLLDEGHGRNASSAAVHGFLTRDGLSPDALRQIGREQLRPYGVALRDAAVLRVERSGDDLLVFTEGRCYRARAVLLATGLCDELPPLLGLDDIYGTSAFHCPFCDGWENRDRPLAVYGRDASVVDYALAMTTFSDDLVLCTDGWEGLDAHERLRLDAHDIEVRSGRIARLVSEKGFLRRIELEDGSLDRAVLFLHVPTHQRSGLAEQLGCGLGDRGSVTCNLQCATNVPGVYVAGDTSTDMNFVAIAAAEGMKAAAAIHTALRREDSDRKVRRG